MRTELQCSKNYFNFFSHKKLELLEITEKEPQKPRPILKKYIYYIFTQNVWSTCSPMQVVVFLQTCINFVEQLPKFSHFEASIIP